MVDGNVDTGVEFSGRDEVLDADGDTPAADKPAVWLLLLLVLLLFVVRLSGANDWLLFSMDFEMTDENGCTDSRARWYDSKNAPYSWRTGKCGGLKFR